jgi:hypothetical protein
MTGSTPAEAAIGMMIGTTIATLAVFDVVSEISTAMTTARMVMESRLETPRASASESPTTLARPVEESSVPSAMPEPESRIVPQSIWAAWFQFSVNRRSAPDRARRNSREEEQQGGGEDRHHALVEPREDVLVQARVVADDQGHDAGRDPQRRRGREREQRVALAAAQPSELGPLLRDELRGAAQLPDFGAVERDEDHAQRREHGEDDRRRGDHPLEARDPRVGLALDALAGRSGWGGESIGVSRPPTLARRPSCGLPGSGVVCGRMGATNDPGVG